VALGRPAAWVDPRHTLHVIGPLVQAVIANAPQSLPGWVYRFVRGAAYAHLAEPETAHLMIASLLASIAYLGPRAVRPGRQPGVRHRHLPQRPRPTTDEPGRDDEWCNPVRQAMGHPPTTSTATTTPGLAAQLWVKPPGESDGICGGENNYLPEAGSWT
jgi:hypothetical protein